MHEWSSWSSGRRDCDARASAKTRGLFFPRGACNPDRTSLQTGGPAVEQRVHRTRKGRERVAQAKKKKEKKRKRKRRRMAGGWRRGPSWARNEAGKIGGGERKREREMRRGG